MVFSVCKFGSGDEFKEKELANAYDRGEFQLQNPSEDLLQMLAEAGGSLFLQNAQEGPACKYRSGLGNNADAALTSRTLLARLQARHSPNQIAP
jgi:hypothetical protein